MTLEQQTSIHGRSGNRRSIKFGTWVAGGFLVLVGLAAIFAPLISPYDSTAPGVGPALAPPTLEHLFGTDELGRDLLSRVLIGGRLALGIPAAGTLLALTLGCAIGLVAAYGTGFPDNLLMRTVDVAIATPMLLLALVLIAAIGGGVGQLVLVLGLLLAPGAARVFRAAALEELQADYREAAVAEGMSPVRIALTEILPNTVPVILSIATLSMSAAILTEASLSFLGLGVAPPAASWGTLLQLGYKQLYVSATYVLIPGALIVATIIALNAIGAQIQDLLDPRRGGTGNG